MNDSVQEQRPRRRRAQMAVNRTNTLVVGAKPLCFTVSRYQDFDNYGWERFYRTEDYGEIGLWKTLRPEYRSPYWGDPQSVEPMTTGYVYIFKMVDRGTPLWKVFKIESGRYQEIKVNDGVVDYNATVGAQRDHVHIQNFFPDDYSTAGSIFVVDSDIKLSQKRLSGEPYSISENPRSRGYWLNINYGSLNDIPENPISGPETLRRYRNRGDMPNPAHYHLCQQTFGEHLGFDLRRPHAFKEAKRRNDAYCQRIEHYQIWLNDEERNKEAYVHQTIAAVLQRDRDREDKLDMRRFRQWRNDDTEQYRQHFFPVHYATESLIEWLDDPVFQQWLLDFNHSEDDDEQLAGLAAYVEGIFELSLTARGREYLRNQFNDDNAFFNMATYIPVIRREYTDPAAHSNFAVEVRKVTNVIFAGLQEFGGIIVKESGEPRVVTRKVLSWAQRKGLSLQSGNSRLSRTVGSRISHVDMEALEQFARQSADFADGFKGRSIISFFEVINLGIAIYGISEAVGQENTDGYHTNIMFSMINAAGAIADLTSSGLFEKQTQKIIQRAGWSSGRVYYLVVFSGLVDFVMGARTSRQELSSGDYDAALGWAIFAAGGVLVAIGGAMKIAGVSGAVGSGGTLSIPAGAIILIGFFIEAIGLLWVWLGNDDELDEWLVKSRFGSRPQFSSVDNEIDALNDLMCKFEVDADFVSDRHVRLEITPRLFPQGSSLKLTRLGTSAKARFVEYFTGDSRDVAVGGTGQGEVTFTPEASTRPALYEREGGRVSKILFDLRARQDIDAVSGNARLEIGPGGHLHGYSTRFDIEKGLFD